MVYRLISSFTVYKALFALITVLTVKRASANCSRAKTLELLEPPGASWSLLAVLAGTWQEPSGTARTLPCDPYT